MRRLWVLVSSLVLLAGAVAPVMGADPWNPPAEVNEDLPPGLVAYHEIGPRLRAIDTASERVKVEVIGESVQGRDLYLAMVSEPRSFGRLGRYMALRNLMLRDPAAAQRRIDEFRDFKVPVFVNGSIHGNEWEGVDASLRLIEQLAFSDDAETRKILRNTIVLFNVVQNPDGRVLGQRRNVNDFDLNRDFATLSQPESSITQRLLAEWNPMVTLDLHGYVGPGGLIEPATPPHNPNYEYDLYIKWAFDQAEAMAAGSEAATGLEPWIPYRDFAPGDWDDWPPIFTPMYAMYHGSYGHTLESPLRVNNSAVNLPPEERRRRAEINTRWHVGAVWEALEFASENRLGMVRDQIEIFRRGTAGEPGVPIPFGGLWGPEDVYTTTFPEAYVIPVGGGQRSETAAARLVNHLLVNDVQVWRATESFTVGGETYPRDSYVVDMNQPKRGLANTMLERGHDISDRVPQMYDISGWSHSLLWGATVDVVARGTDFDVRAVRLRGGQEADGGVDGGRAAAYALELDDVAAVLAVNDLLDMSFSLERTDDGRVLVPADAKPELTTLAATYGLDFDALRRAPDDRAPLERPEIAAAVEGSELFVLDQLGFEVDPVTGDDLDAGFDLSGYDVLMVSSGLDYESLGATARAEVDDFLASGGGLVGRGFEGVAFNDAAGVLPVDTGAGPWCSIANGVVEVEHPGGSPVTASYAPHDTSFVYDPLWFTELGPGVAVSERFAPGDFFVGGHWLGDDEAGANDCSGARAGSGQDDAAGHASIVHGTSDGGRAVLFGTNPLFRDHPKGLFAQVAAALYWTASD
ncbi:MAG TPA: M14 family zinc carboxypeptidase [Actinomycetota bacterium]|nr:M14 family zinc carboxypeptidase [Actinomycetota bacterium]